MCYQSDETLSLVKQYKQVGLIGIGNLSGIINILNESSQGNLCCAHLN